MIIFRKAILIIHGFTGNLYDNEYLMNYLELDPRFDVYARTLPGHNKDRFSDAKMEDWLQFVDNQIQELINNGYRTIYVIGHSMGGILTSYVAGRYKQIKKIVLINAAFDYINLKQNKKDFKERDLEKYSHLWEKALRTSPFMIHEFTKLVKKGTGYLKNVNCPVLILRGTCDEIIPFEVADYIYKTVATPNNKKWVTDVVGAWHTIMSGNRKEVTSGYIRDFLKGGLRWKKNMKKEI